jgi:hypothetical protein
MLSQGVPMLLGGDEIGRTERGNNNGYCQDNDLSQYDAFAPAPLLRRPQSVNAKGILFEQEALTL